MRGKRPRESKVLQSFEFDSAPLRQFSGHVLVIGTGLTAVDIWRRLRKKLQASNVSLLSAADFFRCLSPSWVSSAEDPRRLMGKSPAIILQALQKWPIFLKELPWPALATGDAAPISRKSGRAGRSGGKVAVFETSQALLGSDPPLRSRKQSMKK